MTGGDKKQEACLRFTNEEYCLALRWRLFIHPFGDLPGGLQCPGCKVIIGRLDPYHTLNCNRLGYVTTRHNVVCDLLQDHLLKANRNAVFGATPHYHHPRNQRELETKADILVTRPDQSSKFVDVCVANPACLTHVDEHFSHLNDLAAAGYWEEKKLWNARDTLEAQEKRVVPFVIEATGRLGLAAVDYLHRFVNYDPERQARCLPSPSEVFQARLATVVTRCQASLALQFRRTVRDRNAPPDYGTQ